MEKIQAHRGEEEWGTFRSENTQGDCLKGEIMFARVCHSGQIGGQGDVQNNDAEPMEVTRESQFQKSGLQSTCY